MDNIVFERLEKLEAKIDAIYISVEKTRKYFFWTMVITVVALVLPAIGIALIVPSFISSYAASSSSLSELGL